MEDCCNIVHFCSVRSGQATTKSAFTKRFHAKLTQLEMDPTLYLFYKRAVLMTSFQFAKKRKKKEKKEDNFDSTFSPYFQWMNEWMFNDTAINALIPPPPPRILLPSRKFCKCFIK